MRITDVSAPWRNYGAALPPTRCRRAALVFGFVALLLAVALVLA